MKAITKPVLTAIGFDRDPLRYQGDPTVAAMAAGDSLFTGIIEFDLASNPAGYTGKAITLEVMEHFTSGGGLTLQKQPFCLLFFGKNASLPSPTGGSAVTIDTATLRNNNYLGMVNVSATDYTQISCCALASIPIVLPYECMDSVINRKLYAIAVYTGSGNTYPSGMKLDLLLNVERD